MKNSMKYVTITIVMIFAVLFLTMVRANASQIQLNFNGTGTGNGATNAAPTNQAGVNSAVAKENIVQVNQINDANKDIPQTGETDVYIIAGIAVIAVAIGAFAFIKSKKYNF